jgi:hypothetical protein
MDPAADSLSILDNASVWAVGILFVGILAAYFLSRLAGRVARFLDQWVARNSTGDSFAFSPRFISVVRQATFWLTLAFSVFLALRVLNVTAFAGFLDDGIMFVPRLLLALVILGAGHLLGVTAQAVLARISIVQPESLASRLVYVAILSVAIVTDLDQLGVDTTFLTQLVLVLVVVFLGGLMLTFALGAREYVANLIARSELQRYAPGERIRIGDSEGVVLEIRGTGLDLVTDEGIVSIPAANFARMDVLRIAEGKSNG